MGELRKFIEDREKNFQIPDSPVERINLLAQELALGVHKGLWLRGVIDSLNNPRFRGPIQIFFRDRWKKDDPGDELELLRCHGLAEGRGLLTKAAFDLLQKVTPFKVFVSYRHRESSAFALLVVARLKEFGLQAYCDMRLVPGEPWHPELEDQVRACEYLVLLLGPSTLCSGAVIDEVEWALDAGATVIPITHNRFEFKRKEWEDSVPSRVLDTVERNHRIPIPKEHENAAGYDIAIRTLLVNRFGVSL